MDTLTSDCINACDLRRSKCDSVPYKERVGGSSPSTPTRASRRFLAAIFGNRLMHARLVW